MKYIYKPSLQRNVHVRVSAGYGGRTTVGVKECFEFASITPVCVNGALQSKRGAINFSHKTKEMSYTQGFIT
jgi:hypothetical protein